MKNNRKFSFFFVLRELLGIRFKSLGWRNAPPMFVSFLQGIIWIFGVVSMHFLFDAVGAAVTDSILRPVALGFLFVGGIMLAEVILNNLSQYLSQVNDVLFQQALAEKMHTTAANTDPIAYEDSAHLNDIEKAREAIMGWGARTFTWGFIELFTFYTPFFIFLSVYLFNLRPILPFILALIALPIILENVIKTKIMTEAENRAAPLRRAADHYENALVAREYLKETRQLGAYGFFYGLYRKTLRLFTRERWRALSKVRISDLIFRIPIVMAHVGVIVMLVFSLRDGYITVGAFAAVLATIDRLFDVMYGLFQWGYFSSLPENLAISRNLVNFFHLPKREGTQELPTGLHGISLRNVNFRYPGRDDCALQNINLDIYPGETIALVGVNGAGKSTLVKLMAGLYLPTSGTVQIGGINTAEITMPSLFARASGVFQRYQRYKLTARDNIAISTGQEDDNAMVSTAKQAGVELDAESYPHGLDTMLSREFDGVDLSGGQWQRLAIARGLYRGHNFIVLDEPTAAIDPLEERHIYHAFTELAKDKTAVLVTHRLGASRIARRILVMDEGQIAEEGSHDELMAKNGLYAELFNSQAQWYEGEK